MPIIRIKSLPNAQNTDIARVLEGISKEFAEALAINVDQVYISWEFLPPGHYAHQGRAAGLQESKTHPVQVQLITADLFTESRIALMMEKISEAIARRIHVPFENILVFHQAITSGHFFELGNTQRWESS